MHDGDHRLKLLEQVVGVLRKRGIPHALIGASAMTVHGLNRTTLLPILGSADLILLKLYAGGPQDAWDILQVLEGPDRERLIEAVERELPRLPERCSALWKRVLESGF